MYMDNTDIEITNLFAEAKGRCPTCGNFTEFYIAGEYDETRRIKEGDQEDRFIARRLLEQKKLIPNSVWPGKEPLPQENVGIFLEFLDYLDVDCIKKEGFPWLLSCRRCGAKAFADDSFGRAGIMKGVSELEDMSRKVEKPVMDTMWPAILFKD